MDNTFTVAYNQAQQAQSATTGEVVVTTGVSNALGVVVADSNAMLSRTIKGMSEDQRAAGGELFNLVASGPTGYLIGKGVEYSAPYLPQSAQHALGKVGETLDNATTKMSTGTVGFLVSDENQNIGTYYEGTQTNSENGQSLAQDRVDGTKMVLDAMVSAVGVGGAWKGVTSDAKAVKNGAGDVKSDSIGIKDQNNSTTQTSNVASTSNQLEVESGCKGDWCKALNKPEPNTTYKVDDNYSFHTDAQGRTAKVEGTLNLETADRNGYQQGKAGKSGTDNDEGGHLIATVFNGPGEKINLVPMDGNLNKGEWKKMENTWAAALKENPNTNIKVSVEPVYSGASNRPTSFNVTYRINNGEIVEKTFKNSPSGI